MNVEEVTPARLIDDETNPSGQAQSVKCWPVYSSVGFKSFELQPLKTGEMVGVGEIEKGMLGILRSGRWWCRR